MCESLPSESIGRRGFLKAAAATGAVLLGSGAFADEAGAAPAVFESKGMGEEPRRTVTKQPAPTTTTKPKTTTKPQATTTAKPRSSPTTTAPARVRAADGGADPAAPASTVAPVSTLPPVTVPAPRIVTRADWGADERLRTRDRAFAPITKFVVHHTAGTSNPADPRRVVRDVYRWHVESRKWADLAYNFLIDQDGNVYEGRWARDYGRDELHDGEDGNGRGVIGAHALGFNTGSVGICLLGNFDRAVPTPAALDALVRTIAWKAGPRGIDPTASDPYVDFAGRTVVTPNVSGHRNVGATECPGANLASVLPEIRSRARALLGSGLIGYRVLASDGTVFTYGGAARIGDPKRAGVRTPVAIASGPRPDGYWVLGQDGGVFAFGSAPFRGSLPGLRIRTRAVDMVGTPTGEGYWVLGQDGGVFAFGDAEFVGSAPGTGTRITAVRIQATPTGKGYWILGKDGSVLAFGDAERYGSLPETGIRGEAVDLKATPSGKGYWILGRDGGIFAYGDAAFLGSLPGSKVRWRGPAVAMAGTPDGRGYQVLASDGGVFSFGAAPNFGNAIGQVRRPPVGIATAVQR